jgi:hypothetical protein
MLGIRIQSESLLVSSITLSAGERSLLSSLSDIHCVCYRVSAMIVSFDRVSQRAKVLDKMVVIAKSLRQLNNYMGMNAFVAGINNVRGQDDDELTQLMASRPNSNWKQFKSLQVLVGTARSGQVYRTALKHTPGAAIPDLCVGFITLTARY